MADQFTVHEIQEARIWAKDGERLGTVGEVHLDRGTGDPAWITVDLGLFQTRARFVPLAGARRDDSDIFVNYSAKDVKDAPDVDPESPLTPAQEAVLQEYYQSR